MVNIFASLLCLLMSTAGIVFLFLCWRKTGLKFFYLRIAAWLLSFVALVAWCLQFGAEFGTVYALSAAGIAAWGIILFQAEFRPSKKNTSPAIDTNIGNQNSTASTNKVRGKLLHSILLFLIAGPFAVITLCLISIEIVRLIPVEKASQMVIVALLYPVALGLASYWICYNRKPLRDAGILGVSAMLASLHLFSAQIF